MSELSGILFEAMQKFDKRPSLDEFAAAIKETATAWSIGYLPVATLTHQMMEALDRHESHLGPWPTRAVVSSSEDPDQERSERELE